MIVVSFEHIDMESDSAARCKRALQQKHSLKKNDEKRLKKNHQKMREHFG